MSGNRSNILTAINDISVEDTINLLKEIEEEDNNKWWWKINWLKANWKVSVHNVLQAQKISDKTNHTRRNSRARSRRR